MRAPPEIVTTLLDAAQAGDAGALDRLYALVYDELRGLARVVRRGRAGATLDTTALVHEAYLKLLPSRTLAWKNRAHFFAVVARAMRQVLVNAAERRTAAKHGGGQLLITLPEDVGGQTVNPDELLELDRALRELERVEPRHARIVECRYFSGLSVEETAAALSISVATVKRDWRIARAWLGRSLGGMPPNEE